ncbi:unnamed protein product [Ilex paraguariensis]|uniref:Uncharacterized protein n=1 Tax=Ilex paraguariensis TaxID=185542 RepID=A0ABC8SRN8_9AQUA
MDYPQNPIDPCLSLPQNSIEALDLLKASSILPLFARLRPSKLQTSIEASDHRLLLQTIVCWFRFDHFSQYPFRLSLQILRHGTTTTKILLAIQQTRLFPSTLLPKPLHNNAGLTIVLSYATSGLSVLLSVFCYTEIAMEIPVAGGSFSFLRIELSDFLAFIATGNILLEAVVGAAGLWHSWSSYFARMIKSDADFLRIRVNSFAEGFNLLDPITVVVLAIDNTIAMSGTHRTSCLNWVASIFSAGVIVFIIIVGFLIDCLA